MRRNAWLGWMAAGTLALGACGDDTTPAGDAGTAADLGTNDAGVTLGTCPPTGAPGPANQELPCCYRASNADRQDSAELRMAGLRIAAPAGTLSLEAVRRVLQAAFDEERFNWLIQLDGEGGNTTVKTGFGVREADGTFRFAEGAAPVGEGGDADRWNPVSLTGTITNETLTTTPLNDLLIVPIFGIDDPETTEVDESASPIIELPFRGVQVSGAVFSEERTCIGYRRPGSFDTTQGTISGFIEVSQAFAPLSVPELNIANSNLCSVINGALSNGAYCEDPQSGWSVKPDSICGESGCEANTAGMTDKCDPTSTCNAWRVQAGFAAQGAEINDVTATL